MKFNIITLTAIAAVFTMFSCDKETDSPEKFSIINHQYVDLGLPSGLKWATCNIGAENPEDFGDYFAWGETKGLYSGKTSFAGELFTWYNYNLCNRSYDKLTKYCFNSDYGIVDNKSILDDEDDVAMVMWGAGWRMPTLAEMEELDDNCTWTWTTRNNVEGYVAKSKINGKEIFFPANGFYSNRLTTSEYGNPVGYFWGKDKEPSTYWDSQKRANAFFITPGNHYTLNSERCYGCTVRPVKD